MPISLNQVFPSWFVIYVGPAISLVVPIVFQLASGTYSRGGNGISDSSLLSTCFVENETNGHLTTISAYSCHLAPLALLITSSIPKVIKDLLLFYLPYPYSVEAFFFYALDLFVNWLEKALCHFLQL